MSLRRPHILVVDDEPLVAELVARVFADDGYLVDTAANGRIALAKVAMGGSYDVILCDIRMPELDGPGFYRELAAQHPALLGRIVFMTGRPLDLDVAGLLARTGAPFLAKPFFLHELQQAVRKILDPS